jgi:hypothetical protein
VCVVCLSVCVSECVCVCEGVAVCVFMCVYACECVSVCVLNFVTRGLYFKTFFTALMREDQLSVPVSRWQHGSRTRNTKGGSIIVPLTSC